MTQGDFRNPFDLLAAKDLTDAQIGAYWVDLPNNPLRIRANPTSPVPMFILGGKGSGKTHLMRFLSYPLQKLRFGGKLSIREGIKSEGYLGAYVLAGGLNASRFRGKGQDAQRWQDLFAYLFELWFARTLLNIVSDILKLEPGEEDERLLVAAILDLFDRQPFQATTLDELRQGLRDLQKDADLSINNASSTRNVEIEILATRGSLFFGVPQVLVEHFDFLREARILYLIDELENFTADQQTYINTLVRERRNPVGIKIGARLYGVRTQATLNSGEENLQDSEFEVLKMDFEFREHGSAYRKFVEQLFVKRLVASRHLNTENLSSDSIDAFFEKPSEESSRDGELEYFREKYGSGERPCMSTLRQRLEEGVRGGVAFGIDSIAQIDSVLLHLAVPDDPFCEKLNTFLFYRAWAAKKALPAEAAQISRQGKAFREGKPGTLHKKILSHWRSDVWAQLRRETDRPQQYVGFDAFVTLSAGLPRCVLTILKHVFSWALFYGERPFGSKPISVRAQQDGVAAAAEWFYADARAPGADGLVIRAGMSHIGELLRDLRFSDKPPECALSTFSFDEAASTQETVRVLKAAESWSMLLRSTGGQHEKNTGRVDPKYQVHPMLAPRWDLAVGSRGAVGLSGPEAAAIFDPAEEARFREVCDNRVRRAMAPSFGKRPEGKRAARKRAERKRAERAQENGQRKIPGLGDD